MALDPATWDEACRRRAAGESIRAIAQTLGVSASTLGKRLAAAKPAAKAKARSPRSDRAATKARKPAASRRAAPAAGSAVRRQLIARLYRAIDTKLKLMERRMNSEIDAIDSGGGNTASGDDTSGAARTSADHERETRAFGALVKTINSVRQMQAEIDTIANAPTASANAEPTAADARLAADAERYRRDIAQRLAKFVPPQS
jgi:hypothetical protein